MGALAVGLGVSQVDGEGQKGCFCFCTVDVCNCHRLRSTRINVHASWYGALAVRSESKRTDGTLQQLLVCACVCPCRRASREVDQLGVLCQACLCCCLSAPCAALQTFIRHAVHVGRNLACPPPFQQSRDVCCLNDNAFSRCVCMPCLTACSLPA
jgi:hypothetical protein